MKSLFLILCFAFSFQCFGQELNEYRWKNRLIVLVSEESNAPKAKQQLKLLNQNNKDLLDRDIVLLQRGPGSQDLLQFSIAPNFQGILLIGKDGGLKLKKPFIVAPQKIFDSVDSMPMRRAEMRKMDKH
ncbi:DUF4174 domain-containing protein [Flagellimonas meridianipacifica]|nr:DUF4174 domain-containing protein [Allomuricauda pacifica]